MNKADKKGEMDTSRILSNLNAQKLSQSSHVLNFEMLVQKIPKGRNGFNCIISNYYVIYIDQ